MLYIFILTVGCENCPNGWNDGCNDCFCQNGTTVCTEELCAIKGEPFCKPDCSTILCAEVTCNPDEMAITLPGECCTSCIPS